MTQIYYLQSRSSPKGHTYWPGLYRQSSRFRFLVKRKFGATTPNLGKKAFVIHVAYFKAKISIYPACKAQITLLMVEKVTIPAKYLNYLDLFSKKSVVKLSKYSNINKLVINLKPDKQPP